MKKLLHLVIVLSLALSQACEGPAGEQGEPGPKGDTGAQGPAGPQGLPGTSATATVVDIQGTFTDSNQYALGFNFANNAIEVGESDIVMVYLLAFANEDDAGTVTPFWSPLPQTFYPNEQRVTYNYFYANLGVIVSLEAAAAVLPTLTEAYTTDQIFRIVVIPGSPAGGRIAKADIDLHNYAEVAKYYNITDAKVKRIQVR